MTGRPLTPRQARFVSEYLKDLNATQAAIRAGYSAKTATVCASRMLTFVQVRQEIDRLKSKQIQKADLSATRILEELRRLATVDIADFYDADGRLKPVKDLTPEQGACIASIETMRRNVEAGDGVQDTTYRVKLWDKGKALELLAKHFALLTERIEHSGTVTVYGWADRPEGKDG